MRKRYIFISVLVLCVLANSHNTPANRGKKWALLIGIDTYDSKKISPLRYCVADVNAFKAALTEPAIGGFDPSHVFLMTDKNAGESRPTDTNVLFRLEQLAELVRPEDTFVFYFSGHGMTREGNSLLLSVNADARSLSTLAKSAIPLADVRRFLSSIKAHQTLFILDACWNEPVSGKGDKDNLLTEAFARGIKFRREPSSTTGLPPVTATLYACSVGERAYEWEEKGHSVFSYHLLEGLKGKAADLNGEVTINSLTTYTQEHVNQWTRLNEGKRQNPWLVREGGGKLVLAQVSEISTTASLTVTSDPSGATVYIDRLRIGRTPLHGYQIDTGIRGEKQVEVGLEREGYKSRVAKLTLKNGQKMPWDVRLEKAPTPPCGTAPEGIALIPAGEFQMGRKDGRSDEKPVHTVYIDAFYMDVYEVTNAQYKKFVDATPQWRKDRIPSSYHDGDYLRHWSGNSYPSGRGNHPVAYVSWYGAMAYAAWAGKRLPTEAEWEKAARGGLVGQKYPWGDSIDSSKANYGRPWRGQTIPTTPVGSYAPNGYGLYDMAGNVWEWCLDAYDGDFYKNSPRRNPIAGADNVTHITNNFTSIKNNRVLRGGSWTYLPLYLRVATRLRSDPSYSYVNYGFRCARSVNP